MQTTIKFSNCTLLFRHVEEYGSPKLLFTIERPEYQPIHFDVDEMTELINGLLNVQHILKSENMIVTETHIVTNHYGDVFAQLLTTKINKTLEIKLYGFKKEDGEEIEKYCVPFDINDDIYLLCINFLQFVNDDKPACINLKQNF
jgi:hypothetical protein